MVPPHLRRQLLTALHRNMLAKVPLFDNMGDFSREDFLLELWTAMRPQLYGECKGWREAE